MIDVAELRQQGFTRVPSVFSRIDLVAASSIADELIAGWMPQCDPDFWSFHREDIDRHILYRIHNLQQKHEAFVDVVDHSNLRKIVLEAMGAALPTACALIYKMPKIGAENPWHRDPIDVPPHTVYNFSVFLDAATQDNGPLAFVPGSHVDQCAFPDGRPASSVAVCAEVGDVVVHDVRVYHGSEASKGTARRRSIIIEFQPTSLANASIETGARLRNRADASTR